MAAQLELDEDGIWIAHVRFGDHVVLGHGDTCDDAKDDLRSGIDALKEFLEEDGQSVPARLYQEVHFEIVESSDSFWSELFAGIKAVH
jgi:predicted RNase H-like HicB family nuclease